MTDLTEFEEATGPAAGKQAGLCKVGSYLAELDEGDDSEWPAQLSAALAAKTRVSSAAIAIVCGRHGFSISENTVQKHRAERCACRTQE